jgi:transcriptional regulator with XRE-family HTH domain
MSGKRSDKLPIKAKYPEIAQRVRKKLGTRKSKELGEFIGMKAASVSNYTNGIMNPGSLEPEQFQKFCEFLKISADELLFGEKLQKDGKRFLKITYQVLKNDGTRQILFTATPTDEPPEYEEKRLNPQIYLDLP